MKLRFLCEDCLRQFAPKEGGTFYLPEDPNGIIEMDDRDYYEYICQNGHSNCFFLAMPKYAVLYDMGFSAFQNGFYREAVLDFAASYERFHEYCIYIMLWEEGSPLPPELSKIWKVMSRQSERQLGAFTALFYKSTGEIPQILENKIVKFRNDVTHKGVFPSQEATYDYAIHIADYIKYHINKISTLFGFDPRGIYPQLKTVIESKKPCHSQMFPTLITQYVYGNSFEDSVKVFNAQFKNHYVY